MNYNIQLNPDNSLNYDENGKLCVKSSSKSGNTLTVESDGLYAQSIPGKPGSAGVGYVDGYRSENGIVSGIESPENTQSTPRRVVAPSIVHRIFTCENIDGSDISIRTVDKIYPGDMYRVEDTVNSVWNYYTILSVNNTGTGVSTHSGIVASIPIGNTDVN